MKEKRIENYLMELGTNFVGLWKYQTMYNNTVRTSQPKNHSYCVTICVNGTHIDTHAHKNSIDAFEEASKLLKKLKEK